MKILVACEESQRVMTAFRKKGHLAYSCDLKDCSGEYPEYHIKADCRSVIENNNWDMIIAHPPCTYLCVAGACNLVDSKGNIKDYQRYERMLEAREFFMYFYNLTGCKICIENSRPMARANLPKYSQIIQPFEFGENYSKQTMLWLKDLPLLMPECYTLNKRKFGQSWCEVKHNSTDRSKTFNGIAKAMAKQWSF